MRKYKENLCLLQPAFLLVLLFCGSAAYGDVVEDESLADRFPGRVFLYKSDCRGQQHSSIAGLDKETLPYHRYNRALAGDRNGQRPFSPTRAALNPERIKVLSTIFDEGGMAYDIACSGDYCYVGTSSTMTIFDISTPASPVEVNRIHETGAHMFVEGSLMIAAMGRTADLVLFDISNPAVPVELSRLAPPEDFHFQQVSMSGTMVIAKGYGELKGLGWAAIVQVVDYADPQAPEVKSTLVGLDDYFGDLLIDQDIFYLYVSYEGLCIFDISDPRWIIQLGFLSGTSALGFHLDSGILYMAGYGLEIVDVTDPYAPTLMSQSGTPWPQDVVVSGGVAFLTDDDDKTLHFIDVSDPYNPLVLGDLPANGYTYYMDITGNTICIADLVNGLLTVDVTIPQAPVLLSETSTGDYPMSIDVEGGLAVVPGNLAKLHTVDVSDPYEPFVLGTFTPIPDTTPHNTPNQLGVNLGGATAVTSYRYWGILTYDVSAPGLPDNVGSLGFGSGGEAFPVARVGDLVYTGGKDIVVVDISDPLNPVQVGSGPTMQTGLIDFQILGNTGYASSIDEVVILDMTNPLAPAELSRIPIASDIIGIAVEQDLLCVCCGSFPWYYVDPSLEFYDVSNPLVPAHLSSFRDPAIIMTSVPDVTIDVENGRFFVSGLDQLIVVDATDPSNAFVAAVYPDRHGAAIHGWTPISGVTVDDGLVYIAGEEGLEILRFLDVGVFLDPGTDPLVVPRGGNFSYDVTLENFLDSPQSIHVWIDVLLPSGSTYGPVAGPMPLTLNSGQSLTTTMQHQVPVAAPLGTYHIYAHAGTYPATDMDNDRFTLEVVVK